MSELADRLEAQRVTKRQDDGRVLLGLTDAEWDEAIAALRSEPVCYRYGFKTYFGATHWQLDTAPYNGQREPDITQELYAAPSRETAKPTTFAKRVHCQNGGDVCLAGNWDGVCCPEDSCDIDDGTRKKPADTLKPEAEPALSAEQIEQTARDLFSLYGWSLYGWSDPAHVAMRKKIEIMRDMALSSLTARDAAIDLTIKAFINRYGYDKDQYLVSMLRALKGGK